jgi:GAF domain-containing protein
MLGRVANHLEPIINGSPLADYPSSPGGRPFCRLRSSLAVPLEGTGGLVGVLALYHREPEAFHKDHLRVLLAISSKVSLVIENALRFQGSCHDRTSPACLMPDRCPQPGRGVGEQAK